MRNQRGALGWGVLTILWVGACEQELALPRNGRAPVDSTGGVVDDGSTGTAGAADEGDPSRFGKLPVLDVPIYGAAGGDGGGGGASGVASEEGGASLDAAHAGKSGGGSSVVSPSGGEGGFQGAGEAGQVGAGGATDTPPAGPPQLLFSEYVEGSGTFKALELYALAPSSLEGCEILTYTNGESDGPSRLALHGALAEREAYVLCTSKLAMEKSVKCDRSTNLSFNGDDALSLVCNHVTLDVFGQIGDDPGTAWGEGATIDHTLRRRCVVAHGNVDGRQPFDPNAEWLLLATDTFTGLGEHSCTVSAEP